jgi:hypothetical protein
VNRWSLSAFRRVLAVQLAQNACKPINILPFGVLNNLNNKLSGQFPDPGEISRLKIINSLHYWFDDSARHKKMSVKLNAAKPLFASR